MNRNVFEALKVRARGRILKTLFESPQRSRSQNYFDVYFCSFELHTSKTSPTPVASSVRVREREGAFKQVRRFTDESRIWNGASTGSRAKSTVSDRVITIKWSNDSVEKGIETSFRSKEVCVLAGRPATAKLNEKKKFLFSLIRRGRISIDPSILRNKPTNGKSSAHRGREMASGPSFRLLFNPGTI